MLLLTGHSFFLTKTYSQRYQEGWFYYPFQTILPMSYLYKPLLAALVGVAALSSCSRPVAHFQNSQREYFKSSPVETVAVTAPSESAQPVVVTPKTQVTLPNPVEQVAQAKVAMKQLDAYVKNDSKLAGNKKLAKRMARANALLTEAEANPVAVAAPRKATFVERMTLKKLDRKIKYKMAPDQTKDFLDNKLRNGIIVGAIGLLLAIIFGGVLGIIGVILLAAGIVLIVLGVLET